MWWIEPVIATVAVFGLCILIIGFVVSFHFDFQSKVFDYMFLIGAFITFLSFFSIITIKIWESYI